MKKQYVTEQVSISIIFQKFISFKHICCVYHDQSVTTKISYSVFRTLFIAYCILRSIKQFSLLITYDFSLISKSSYLFESNYSVKSEVKYGKYYDNLSNITFLVGNCSSLLKQMNGTPSSMTASEIIETFWRKTDSIQTQAEFASKYFSNLDPKVTTIRGFSLFGLISYWAY